MTILLFSLLFLIVFIQLLKFLICTQKTETKKSSKLFMKLNSLDRSHSHKVHADGVRPNTSKCSVQEGVRMMVTPSMFMTGGSAQERAVLNPPVNVQRAIVVTQENFEANKATTITTTAITNDDKQVKVETVEIDTAPVVVEATAKVEAGTSKPIKATGILLIIQSK